METDLTTNLQDTPNVQPRDIGDGVLSIPIRGGIAAGLDVIIDGADFLRLTAMGMRLPLYCVGNGRGDSFVRCGCGSATGTQLTAARLVVNAGRGEVVRHRNGNRLDLRRDNLVKVPGRAFRNDVAELRAWSASGRARASMKPSGAGPLLSSPSSATRADSSSRAPSRA